MFTPPSFQPLEKQLTESKKCVYTVFLVATLVIRHIDEYDDIKASIGALSTASSTCLFTVQSITNNNGQWNSVASSTYIFSCILAKLSIGFYLLRVISHNSPRRRQLVISVMALVSIVNFAHFVYRMVYCRTKPQLYTTPETNDAPTNLQYPTAEDFCAVKEASYVAMVVASAVVNILADIAFILVPLPEIIHSLREKKVKGLVVVVSILISMQVPLHFPLLHE
jgi:hypothetical protein